MYNGARYLAQAIGSVVAQTRPPIECLVIDDGSTDETPRVARRFGGIVTHIRLDHGGVARARNRGIQLARGELVAFLDHDDMWLPAKLERQLESIRGRHDAVLCLCGVRVIDSDGALQRIKRLATKTDLLTGMITFDGSETVSCSSAGLARRRWLAETGGFDEALSTSADWDLLRRAALEADVAYVDEPLVEYRRHELNMSRDIGAMERDRRYGLAKAFADPRLPTTLREQRRHAYGRFYRMLAGSYREVGARRDMLRCIAISAAYDPVLASELVSRVRHRIADALRP